MVENCKTLGNCLQKLVRYPWEVGLMFIETLLKTLSRVLSSRAVCCLIRPTFCIISCKTGLAERQLKVGGKSALCKQLNIVFVNDRVVKSHHPKVKESRTISGLFSDVFWYPNIGLILGLKYFWNMLIISWNMSGFWIPDCCLVGLEPARAVTPDSTTPGVGAQVKAGASSSTKN